MPFANDGKSLTPKWSIKHLFKTPIFDNWEETEKKDVPSVGFYDLLLEMLRIKFK